MKIEIEAGAIKTLIVGVLGKKPDDIMFYVLGKDNHILTNKDVADEIRRETELGVCIVKALVEAEIKRTILPKLREELKQGCDH